LRKYRKKALRYNAMLVKEINLNESVRTNKSTKLKIEYNHKSDNNTPSEFYFYFSVKPSSILSAKTPMRAFGKKWKNFLSLTN